MIPTTPLDLTAVWHAHIDRVLAERDDAKELHASDLHSCAYALQQRVHGVPQLPHGDGSFANFERGLALEARMDLALREYVREQGLYTLAHGGVCEHRGIVGNLDWRLYDAGTREIVAVIDLSTTASSSPQWKYGHALKSAFYAVATGAPRFCEWVFCIGFGGKIVAHEAHWFDLDSFFEGISWRDRVDMAIDNVLAISRQIATVTPEPPIDPMDDEPETWRCGKVAKTGKNAGNGTSYCRARCPRNAAYDAENEPL